MATTLTPSHMAAHMDLSPDTLRCNERTGFMPRVQRLRNGHRRHGESVIEWLELVECRRRRACRFGTSSATSTQPSRETRPIPNGLLLHEHRTNVVAQTAKLQHDLEHLAWKLAYYAGTFGVTAGEATP
jgi:DNA-binding transcriptional MerR regulator